MAAVAIEKSGSSGPDEFPMRSTMTIPTHLDETPWLEFEQATVLALCESVEKELNKLMDKASAKQVHDTRVALRRWFSVWWVLKQDHWQSKKFKRQAITRLRRLLRTLGSLRDWDVNIALGEELGCSKEILKSWDRERDVARDTVKKTIKSLNPGSLMRRVRKYLKRRPARLKAKLPETAEPMESAYNHIDGFILAQEETVRELEMRAHTPEELHELRLGVKRWRYLLTEFFGLTNLQLVRTQQILGKLHDLDRIKDLLAYNCPDEVGTKLEAQRRQLLQDFSLIRESLPYGLRPLLVSVAPAASSGASGPD